MQFISNVIPRNVIIIGVDMFMNEYDLIFKKIFQENVSEFDLVNAVV